VREDFLHYIWRYKLFSLTELKTVNNKSVIINKVGEVNTNAGPDFFNAQLKINNQLWAGNVEIHIKSSDWYVHGHEKDENYDSIVLHVVWKNDVSVYRKDNSVIPTLELYDIVDEKLLENYNSLFSKNQKWINCENNISTVDKFKINNWLERLYFERLEQKALIIADLLKQSNNDWEAVLFKLLAKNFGLKINSNAFFNLANTIDFSIIRKESHDLEVIEALFFGQAGLLEEQIEDSYYLFLKNEYSYLYKKHKLKASLKNQMSFFRLRPSNFPTIRLAQFAKLYNQHQNLFSKLIEISKLEEFYDLFEVSASSFWDTHYTFKTTSKKQKKKLTKSFVDLLLINTIIPLKFIYLKHMGKLDEESIIKLINKIKPEKNTIINKFNSLNIKSKSALDTQSLLQLKNEYCSKQRCLQCRIGVSLLKDC